MKRLLILALTAFFLSSCDSITTRDYANGRWRLHCVRETAYYWGPGVTTWQGPNPPAGYYGVRSKYRFVLPEDNALHEAFLADNPEARALWGRSD